MLKSLRSRLGSFYAKRVREHVKAFSFGWVVFAKRVQSARQISLPGGVELLDSAQRYAPITVTKPLFYIEHESQTGQLKHYLENPNLQPYDPKVVVAKGVRVSSPSMVHRWRGMAFLEGLLDDTRNMSYPRLVLDFESLPWRSSSRQPVGALLALPLYSNYYHWMIELLPRLQLLAEHPALNQLPLLVPDEVPPFVREALRISGHIDRVQFLPRGVHRLDKVYIPTLLSPPSHPAPHAVSWLRSNLMPGASSQRSAPKRRIYISRRDATARFASNEREVEALLSRFSFETVVMSDYSLEQQVELFAGAEIIVGLHGASLTNLVFSDEGTYVIELFMAGWFTNAFYHIAMIRRHHYGYLVCPQDGAGQYVPLEWLETLIHRVLRHAADRANPN